MKFTTSLSGFLAAATLLFSPVNAQPQETKTISGVVLVNDPYYADGTSHHCTTKSFGYRDIGKGKAISIENKEGEIISVTHLQSGVGISLEGNQDINTTSIYYCAFPFEADVRESEFYKININNRGSLPYSRKELEQQDWEVLITIGFQ